MSWTIAQRFLIALTVAVLAVRASAAPPTGPKPKELTVFWYGHKEAVLMLNGQKDAGEQVERAQNRTSRQTTTYQTATGQVTTTHVTSYPIFSSSSASYQVKKAVVQVKTGDVIGLRVPGNDYGYTSSNDFTVLVAMSDGHMVFATDLRNWGWADGEPPGVFWTGPMGAGVKKARRATNASPATLRDFFESAGCAGNDVVPILTGKAMTSLKHVITVADVQNIK